LFQSSSGPKTGCHRRWSRRAGGYAAGFNPHPARRPDATPGRTCLTLPEEFQSSSGPKTGCHLSAISYVRLLNCFNPHPARRPDATRSCH